jgi:ubiquinone/menaquinone biosynthesis C-methylase UbiE
LKQEQVFANHHLSAFKFAVKNMEEALYNSIGIEYNQTRTADPFLVEKLSSLMTPKKNSAVYLDVGCGTGNYTVALASKGYSFYGVEPSEVMLEKAKQKSRSVVWIQGIAENLPFDSSSFGGALSTLTTHHWKDLERGFAEVFRVLKKKSDLVIFTAFPEQMEGYWLNHYFPKMLKESMFAMPSRQKVEAALHSAGFIITCFEKYFIQPELQDFFLYSGKFRPSLYFNAEVRKNISSFSALTNKEEVDCGLRKLSTDIENGDFVNVAQKYENDMGDYCFIVAKKLPNNLTKNSPIKDPF